MNKTTALRILLALVGLAHLILGLIACVAPPEILTKAVVLSYGAAIEVTPQLRHVVSILGVFMIGVGIMACLACRDPLRSSGIIIGIIVILGLRVIQRVLLTQEITQAFNVSAARLWMQAAFFLIVAVGLFVLRPRPASSGGSTNAQQ